MTYSGLELKKWVRHDDRLSCCVFVLSFFTDREKVQKVVRDGYSNRETLTHFFEQLFSVELIRLRL